MIISRHTGCNLFVLAIIGALYCPDSAFGEGGDVAVSTAVTPNSDPPSDVSTISSEPEGTTSVQILPGVGSTGNGDLVSSATTKEVDDDRFSVKTIQKKELDEQMLNDFKSFLLFPFLPFLFPPGDDKSPLSGADSAKPDGNDPMKPGEGKPFILFDFAFNFREIPLANGTKSNDSKIINVKKIGDASPSPPTKEDEVSDLQRERGIRNSPKRGESGLFDDFPLLPGSPFDDLFSKPEFFFPGFPKSRTRRKVNRRKRDVMRGRGDMGSDLQFFMDAIDRAFMETKNDFEETDPILEFLKGVQSPFDANRKIHFPDQEGPNVNWKIQRNVKRLNGEVQDKGVATESRDVPMIVLDKVVKIGEFHVGDDKNKVTNDKRTGNELKRKYMNGLNHDEVRIPTLYKKDKEDGGSSNKLSNPGTEVESIESPKRTKKSDPGLESHSYDAKSREIRILPQVNPSVVNAATTTSTELKRKDAENNSESDKFVKLIDSMRRLIKIDLTNDRTPSTDRLKRRSFHDDLKRNITQVLNLFFELVRKLDDARLMEKLEDGERDMEKSFDWTETETLQNANAFGKEKKPKKEFQKYLDSEKKERQVADLNYLFMTVTLPTILVFALVILVCFFNLQLRGKIWTRFFNKPRQIFVVEGKPSAQLNSTAVRMKSPQSI